MEEGSKAKKTVFVGGISEEVDESIIYESFSTFGDIIEVQLPSAATNTTQQAEGKHRGFAFVTYSSSGDAQDAIDNMDLNELRGRVIKVNLARPMKGPSQFGSRKNGCSRMLSHWPKVEAYKDVPRKSQMRMRMRLWKSRWPLCVPKSFLGFTKTAVEHISVHSTLVVHSTAVQTFSDELGIDLPPPEGTDTLRQNSTAVFDWSALCRRINMAKSCWYYYANINLRGIRMYGRGTVTVQ